MANKLLKTQELFGEEISIITKNPSEWLKFLDTCSNNYKFSFTEQVLIYAQKPDATYLAEIEQWNRKLHRWIKKDTKGVALIENDGINTKLKHVFDISDTYDKFGRKVSIWQVNHRFDEEIIEDLENTYGNLEMKSNLSEAIISASYNMVEDNFQDYFTELNRVTDNSLLEDLDEDTLSYYFRRIMSNSVAYMMMKRCGLTPEDYFSENDFREITNFNTIQTITKLGMATSDIAENGLREIYDTNRILTKNSKNKNYTFDRKNNNYYNENKSERSDDYGNNISQRGRLPNTRYNSGESREETTRDVWQSQTEIFEGTQERNMVRANNDEHISEPPSRDRTDSNYESKTDNRATSQTEQGGREDEGRKSNALGTEHEQLQSSSGGNGLSGTNLQLNLFENNITEEKQRENIDILEETEPNIDENIAEVEITPANFYAQNTEFEDKPLILSQEQIDNILIYGGVVEESKFRIYDHLTNPYNNEKPSDFLKREYGDGGYSSENGWIDFSSKGISVTKGENKTLLKWNNLAKRNIEIINEGRFFNEEEQKGYKDYIKNQKRNFAEEYVDFCIDNNIFDWGELRDEQEEYEDVAEVKTKEERIEDTLKLLESKEDILQEIEYLNSVKLAMAGDELEIQLEKYINSFNRYYNALDIEENKQINVIDLTTPEAQEFIQTAQNINNLFKAREENGAPLDRYKYYQDNEISTENNINQEKINYHITDKEIGAGTPRERYRNNVEAIKTLKKIENENRLATKEEQEILSKYVGWGGLADAFDESKWTNEYKELKELLTEEEYNNAKESVLTAFYTPPIVINSIYKAIQNMGFEQGNVLEPSCGVGNFFGMIPQELEKSKLYGVELDSISGRIAKQLYQNANIQVKGYEKTNLQDSFFDVAIGNIPFNNFKLSDPRYDKNNFLIHDYFFAKTLDKVRPRWCYCIYNK